MTFLVTSSILFKSVSQTPSKTLASQSLKFCFDSCVKGYLEPGEETDSVIVNMASSSIIYLPFRVLSPRQLRLDGLSTQVGQTYAVSG